jgi:hypothetical protein
MRYRTILAVLVCLPAGLARGEARIKTQVKTTDSLTQVLPFLNSRTLLVVDIDNTLLEPRQNLGSDPWYRYLLRRLRDRGLAAPLARDKAIAVWNRLQDRIEVRPVEPGTPRLLRAQQDHGVCTLGLTSRSLTIARRTRLQLESIGVQLHRRPCPGAHRLLRHGILFAGEGNDKGALLVRFLRGRRPDRVVFVDDRQENVDDVARALERASIPAIVFRYTAVDARVRAFEADLADPELFINGESRQKR